MNRERFKVSLSSPLSRVLKFFSFCFFGNRCIACRSLISVFSDIGFCDKCEKSVKVFDNKRFSNEEGELMLATAPYFSAWRKSLIHFKFHGAREAGEYHAKRIAKNIMSYTDISEYDGILCVPAIVSLERKRRYNQAEVLARNVADFLDLPFCDYMEKKKDIKSQTTCKNSAERFKNVRGAYGLNEEGIKNVSGKSFILIDDITTTGATLSECGKALRAGGVRNILYATAAKTVIGGDFLPLRLPIENGKGDIVFLKKRWKKPENFEKAARRRLNKTLLQSRFFRK